MFRSDSNAECFIESLGGRWKYDSETRFSHFIPKWDAENLGRSQARIRAAVTEYGGLMDAGSLAPAPILWRVPKLGKLRVLDGMQRLLAAEVRQPAFFNAYHLLTDSQILAKKVQLLANKRLHGSYQESNEWTLENALRQLVFTGEMTVNELAALGGWLPATVREKKNVLDLKDAIHRIGGPEDLSDAFVKVVARAAPLNDFQKAAKPIADFFVAAKKTGMSADDLSPHVETFFHNNGRKKKIHDYYEKKLDKFLDDDEIATRLGSGSSRYSPMTGEGKLKKALNNVHTVAQNVLAAKEPIPNMPEFYKILNSTRDVLKQIERLKVRK